MAYCNLHEELLRNDWYLSLKPSQALAWIHLLVLAARDQGLIRLSSTRRLAAACHVTEDALKALLTVAGHRLTITREGYYQITDWLQWNKPRDISRDRVRTYREKKRATSPLQTDFSNANVTKKEKKRGRKEEEDSHTTFQSPEKEEWNKLCSEIKILNKDTISRIGSAQIAKLETRRKEPDFDFTAICSAIRAATQLHNPSGKGWVVSFDWLIDSEPHYQSILRQGRIARDHPSSNGQQQSIQPASAAKLQYEIDAEEEANLVKSGKMDISDATPQLRGLINSIINKGKA